MNTITTAAIDALYEAFKDVPKPHYVDGCPCCIEKKEISTLLTKPLSEITADQLSSYASSLFLTVGDETDFFYFLPRIFDIAAADSSWWPDPEVAVGKLSFVEWKDLNEEKVEAIASYLNAVFEEFVESGSNDSDSWLCALARTNCGLDEYLNELMNSPNGLIAVYESNSKSLMKRRLSNGFWEDVPEARNRVIDWFESNEVKEAINSAYEKTYTKTSEQGASHNERKRSS